MPLSMDYHSYQIASSSSSGNGLRHMNNFQKANMTIHQLFYNTMKKYLVVKSDDVSWYLIYIDIIPQFIAKNYSQHFIKLKEPTFASLTRFAGILTKWWSISKMKNGLSGQGKLYHVINLRNFCFRDVEQFSNRLANHFLSLGFKWVETRTNIMDLIC